MQLAATKEHTNACQIPYHKTKLHHSVNCFAAENSTEFFNVFLSPSFAQNGSCRCCKIGSGQFAICMLGIPNSLTISRTSKSNVEVRPLMQTSSFARKAYRWIFPENKLNFVIPKFTQNARLAITLKFFKIATCWFSTPRFLKQVITRKSTWPLHLSRMFSQLFSFFLQVNRHIRHLIDEGLCR